MKEKVRDRLAFVEKEIAFYQKQVEDIRASEAHPMVVHVRILIKHYREERAFLQGLIDYME